MLVRLTEERIPAFLEACSYEHVYGAKIRTCLQAYGLEHKAHTFFLCEEGGKPAAALYVASGTLTVASDGRENPAEVEAVAKNEGVQEIECGKPLCLALQKTMGGEMESSWFMVYAGGPVKMAFPDIVPGDLRAVFDVLQRSHEYYRQHYRFDPWSADLREKLNKGLIEVYQLVKDDQVVGTGSITAQDDECGIVGSVAVVPEYRHQGLGKRISTFLTGRIQQLGKTPRLMPGYDAVAELYRQVGYVECGNWGELYL